MITELQVRFNPDDTQDNNILAQLRELRRNPEDIERRLDEIDLEIAKLLKFEWEKAKNEASPFYVNRLNIILNLLKVILFGVALIILPSSWFSRFPNSYDEFVRWIFIISILLLLYFIILILLKTIYFCFTDTKRDCIRNLSRACGIPVR